MSALQPLTLAAGSSATSCTPPDMRIVTSVNAKYNHVLVNQISHIHHMDCAPPIEYHCTDEASFNLCETLAVESDTATCVLADCPNCNTREGISFLKFYLLRDALRREMPSGEGASGVLYIDATALVQGASCLNELVATDTDVAVSAEDMSPGCPLKHVLADVGVHGLNANTGLIWARRTEEAVGLLNDLIGRYEEVGSKGNPLCPEQAFFGNYLNTHGTREAAVGSASSMSLQVAYNATRVAYDGQPARVTILDYARWPRFSWRIRVPMRAGRRRSRRASQARCKAHVARMRPSVRSSATRWRSTRRQAALGRCASTTRSCAAPRRRARKGAARKPSSLRRTACGTCDNESTVEREREYRTGECVYVIELRVMCL